jgi:hypothetical protein
LRFSIALAPEAWELGGDGVEFAVRVVDDGRPSQVYRRYIDPKSILADRAWQDAEVDLSQFAGRPIELNLETRPGPERNNQADWALWGEPVIIPADQARLQALKQP